MLSEYIAACLLIFVAEMGDKTQILAMTFATKYHVHQVLIGVMLGSLVNHGIAVVLGSYLANVAPLGLIRIIAAFAFIAFGIWTLTTKEKDEEDADRKYLGPVFTVAMAFFVGELGDKTQLAAITLATSATYPLFILLGTVSGMVLTSALGIYIGRKLGHKIPELALKLASAGVFVFFGLISLWENVPSSYMTLPNIAGFLFFLALILTYLVTKEILASKQRESSLLQRRAELLHQHIYGIRSIINELCLGEETCTKCQGRNCPVGLSKQALTAMLVQEGMGSSKDWVSPEKEDKKSFDLFTAREGLLKTMAACHMLNQTDQHLRFLDSTRQSLEQICFGKTLSFDGDLEDYLSQLKKESPVLALRLRKMIENQEIE